MILVYLLQRGLTSAFPMGSLIVYTKAMSMEKITVHNVRSYELFSADIHPQTTLILGDNGTGKTTLLEAIYLAHRGTSFRGRDRDIIPHNNSRAEIKVELSSGETRRLSITHTPDDKVVKEFIIADSKSARISPSNRLPVVLFEPDELRLLTSSPQRRREFIDGIIARLSPTYQTVLGRFQRTLLQRNELLKQFDTMNSGAWESHLFAWDIKLAELSATIIKARRNFMTHCNDYLSPIYSRLAGSSHSITARYVSSTEAEDEALQQAILHRLEASRQSDALRGFTSNGPHRDDIELFLDGHLASETASRGEMRTIMLAFKLLEVQLQEHHSGQKPLLLLDDVFSELDLSREQALIEALKEYQTVITATDLRDELKADASIIYLS
ncbi:DNA replication and repair protein RecF [Candidatus Saccharibacteria bacterium RAAC3_TM7_1]|nr:DNA replication and repair protein RecF [Candidatus Saccharibacteria bacterium RAAC3_TM7_1]